MWTRHFQYYYKNLTLLIKNMFFTNIFNWLKQKITSWNWNQKKGKVVFLGLDDAGKSTLLLRLKQDRIAQLPPTLMPHAEELMIGNIKVTAWDLGGHVAARKTWKYYYPEVSGIVFLIDSSCPSRFQESRLQLQGILEQQSLKDVPIVILGNKIDKKGAVSVEELMKILQGRPINMFMCSIKSKGGYGEAFRWLGTYL